MRLNPDCVRSVLKYIEEHQVMGPTGEMNHITKEQLQSALSSDYSPEDVLYSVIQLSESRIIHANILKTNQGIVGVFVFDITPDGHELLENIRQDNVWSKVKVIAQKVGSSSLSALSSIATDVVKDIIKNTMGFAQ